MERWLQTHDTSPLTNEKLPHKNLIPNNNLRSQVCYSLSRSLALSLSRSLSFSLSLSLSLITHTSHNKFMHHIRARAFTHTVAYTST